MDQSATRGAAATSEQRKAIDCRDFPGSNCSLRMEGTEEEVLKAGMEHAVSSHGYKNTPDLKNQLRAMLVDA